MNENVMECLQNFGVKHYNCAQSVLCTYADELGVDKEVLYRLAESLGGGFGGMEEVCGAFSAACLVIGYYTSDGNLEGGHSKFVTRKAILDAAGQFREKMGSIICREILAADEHGRGSCAKRVRMAAEIVEKFLAERRTETE